MTIKVSCACGKSLSVKDDFAGRKVKCPACQKPLLVPAAEEFAEDDFADEPAELPQKSRGGEKSASRGKGEKKGKKSSGAGGGLVIGLVAGGCVLGVGLVAWMLWPAKPDVVAEAPAGHAAGAPATDGPGTASPAVTPTPSVPTVSVPTPPAGPKDDLQWLQGTWTVSEVSLPPNAPRAAEMSAHMKLMTWTIQDDILTMTAPQGATASKLKLDPSQTPKTIDMTPLGAGQAGLGLYSADGETWRLCITEGGTVRPKARAPDQGILLTLQRGSPTAAAPASLFNMKAWQAAEGQLKAMKVFYQLESVAGERGFPKGLTHVVIFDPPATADGTMSPELWTIVSSLSHVQARPVFSTDASLLQLSQHPGLLGINLSGTSTVTAKGISSLKTCPNLRSLYFSGVPVSPELLGAVTQLTELRGFGINDAPVSNDMLGSITQLSQLESLSLYNTGTTDEDTVQIAKLTNLKALLVENRV